MSWIESVMLGANQHNTSLSTTVHIFKHGGGCMILWLCLSPRRHWTLLSGLVIVLTSIGLKIYGKTWKCEFVFQWKADWTMFSSRILPVLSSIPFIFIPKKNCLVLVHDKHIHNMLYPPPCLEILSTQCCVGFALNITLCIQDITLISLPQFYFSSLLQTGCMFWNICIMYRLPSFYSAI